MAAAVRDNASAMAVRFREVIREKSKEQQAIGKPADRGNTKTKKEAEAQDHFMDRG